MEIFLVFIFVLLFGGKASGGQCLLRSVVDDLVASATRSWGHSLLGFDGLLQVGKL
jgi:hypothetical protein